MQIIFGSIVSLQILAHMPLANVVIPARSQQSFDIMVQVVSFDYFPFTDYFDLGFTPTEPWSLRFQYLSYETINFIEGLGSIMLFIWAYCIFFCVVFVVWLLKNNKLCCFKPSKDAKVPRLLQPGQSWVKLIQFVQGSFFEVMVSISISMRMFNLWPYLNAIDKFSVGNMLPVLMFMTLFIGLIAYFAIFKARKLVILKSSNKKEKHKEVLDSVRKTFLVKTVHEFTNRKDKRFRKQNTKETKVVVEDIVSSQ